jgi:hypothetical protein
MHRLSGTEHLAVFSDEINVVSLTAKELTVLVAMNRCIFVYCSYEEYVNTEPVSTRDHRIVKL